jgi:hypothetical protein
MAHRLRLAIAAVAVVALAGCGDESGNPLAPAPSTSNGTSSEQINGTIQSVSPPSTLVVSGQSIQTTSGTTIRQSGLPLAFGDLRAGLAVQIAATRQGSTLTASTIDVTSSASTVGTPRTIRGEVLDVSGSADNFTLRVGGETVRGNGASIIREGSRTRSFGEIDRGDEVEVDGLEREMYVYAEAVDVLGDDTGGNPSPVPNPPATDDDDSDDDDAGTTVTVDGRISVLSGACPLLVMTVDEEPVITTALTNFNVAACADLRTGDRVEITGTREGGGLPIVATSVKRQ